MSSTSLSLYQRGQALWSHMIKSGFLAAVITSYGLLGLTIILQIFLVPLYLEHLGKAYFGVFTIILSILSFSSIGIGWVSGSIIRMLGECAALNKPKELVDTYIFSKLLYTGYAITIIALFWLVAPFWLNKPLADPHIFGTAILTCIYIVLMFSYSADRMLLTALKQQTRANVFDAIAQIIFATTALIGLYNGAGLYGIVLGQIIGVVTSQILVWVTWKHAEISLHLNIAKRDWRTLWQSVSGPSGRYYAIYGALVLILQSDILIIGAIAGPIYSADYYILWKIPEVIIIMLWRIPGTLTPYVIHMQATQAQDQIRRIYNWGGLAIVGAAAFAGLIYAFLGHEILTLWVGPTHAPQHSWPYILAGLATMSVAISKWPISLAYALGYVRPLVWAALFELVGKVILTIVLLPYLGYIAPIGATVLTYALGGLWMYHRAMQPATPNGM